MKAYKGSPARSPEPIVLPPGTFAALPGETTVSLNNNFLRQRDEGCLSWQYWLRRVPLEGTYRDSLNTLSAGTEPDMSSYLVWGDR